MRLKLAQKLRTKGLNFKRRKATLLAFFDDTIPRAPLQLLKPTATQTMINRRTLLLGSASLAAGSVLTSCRSSAANTLDVTLLEGAIPVEVLQAFRKQMPTPVNFQTQIQMQGVFQQLQRWQQPREDKSWSRFLPWRSEETQARPHQLVSLGDYWLKGAIAANLIEPLSLSTEQRSPLPSQWQQFVTRDQSGQITASDLLWAAPYKVQSLVILYRQSGNQPNFSQWSDLLDPKLKGQIALPNHPGLVIGLLQKMQTGSFNTSFESLVNSSASTLQLVEQLSEALAEPFAALNRQVKTYDSQTALKALANEDVKAIVIWSGDVVTALQRYRSLRAVMPEEGSLLSADMWVKPKGAPMTDAAQSWIDFCWQPEVASQLSLSGGGLSPIFLGQPADDSSEFPETLKTHRLSPIAMANSEPLLPLPDSMQAAYFELWKQLRTKTA